MLKEEAVLAPILFSFQECRRILWETLAPLFVWIHQIVKLGGRNKIQRKRFRYVFFIFSSDDSKMHIVSNHEV